jgi:hypothetical protein
MSVISTALPEYLRGMNKNMYKKAEYFHAENKKAALLSSAFLC